MRISSTIIEETEVIRDPVYGMQVEFYGEMINGKNGSFMRFFDISPISVGGIGGKA